jgi:peptidoglycan hydrolase-like protein with peptidoglycan-binding domain
MAAQRQLQRGANGDDVRKLAEILGYYSSVPGVFDYNLEDRVKAFQRSKGLKDDGIVGPRTLAALPGGYIMPPQMAYNGKVLFTYNGNGTYRRVRDGATVTYAQAQAQQFDEWRRDQTSVSASPSVNPGSVRAVPSGNHVAAPNPTAFPASRDAMTTNPNQRNGSGQLLIAAVVVLLVAVLVSRD